MRDFSGCLIGEYRAGAGRSPIRIADSSKLILETSFPK
jgi:hypothetical protein